MSRKLGNTVVTEPDINQEDVFYLFINRLLESYFCCKNHNTNFATQLPLNVIKSRRCINWTLKNRLVKFDETIQSKSENTFYWRYQSKVVLCWHHSDALWRNDLIKASSDPPIPTKSHICQIQIQLRKILNSNLFNPPFPAKVIFLEEILFLDNGKIPHQTFWKRL